MRLLLTIFLVLSVTSYTQTETLTNNEIVLMTRAGLSKDLIVRKIKDSIGKFDVTAQGLIDLKKAGVSDDVIVLMFEKLKTVDGTDVTNESDPEIKIEFSSSTSPTRSLTSRINLEPSEALRTAKTVAIEKSSVHPSRQALEKELLKRKEWKDLNLNVVRYKDSSDLHIEIGRVPFSWITHRYVWRVYDTKSGTVIAAGETTSWGSLAKNMAREISKKLESLLN